MSTGKQCESSGGEFLLGAGIVGAVALIHNAGKNEQHQQELQEVHWQGVQRGRTEMMPMVSAKEAELQRLTDLLRQKNAELTKKDAEIARLNSVVENQAKTLVWQQLQLTVPLLSSDSDGNGGSMKG